MSQVRLPFNSRLLVKSILICRFSIALGFSIHAPSVGWKRTPDFKCGLLIATAFQREQNEKGEKE